MKRICLLAALLTVPVSLAAEENLNNLFLDGTWEFDLEVTNWHKPQVLFSTSWEPKLQGPVRADATANEARAALDVLLKAKAIKLEKNVAEFMINGSDARYSRSVTSLASGTTLSLVAETKGERVAYLFIKASAGIPDEQSGSFTVPYLDDQLEVTFDLKKLRIGKVVITPDQAKKEETVPFPGPGFATRFTSGVSRIGTLSQQSAARLKLFRSLFEPGSKGYWRRYELSNRTVGADGKSVWASDTGEHVKHSLIFDVANPAEARFHYSMDRAAQAIEAVQQQLQTEILTLRTLFVLGKTFPGGKIVNKPALFKFAPARK